MKDFFKRLWEEIKKFGLTIWTFIQMNWKTWITLGLNKLIEIINGKNQERKFNKELKRAKAVKEIT